MRGFRAVPAQPPRHGLFESRVTVRQGILWVVALATVAWRPDGRVRAELPPLTSDYLAEEKPLTPPGISGEEVVVSATYAYLWRPRDEVQAICAYGDFSLRVGEHVLRSRDGVVWLTESRWEGRLYYEMEVFLWQDAEVRHPGGTIETGPALLVTVASFGPVRLNVASHARQSDEGGSLYQRAAAVRESISAVPAEPTTTAPQEESAVRLRTASAERLAAMRPPRPPRRIDYSGRDLSSQIVADQRVVVAIGDVRISQSEGVSGEALELQADAAVLYLSQAGVEAALPEVGTGREGRREPAEPRRDARAPQTAAEEPPLEGEARTDRQRARDLVTGAYLEGDVVLKRGTRMIRATQLYYDFEADRALLLDVVMSAVAPGRDVPVYVRAERVRQLSASEYMARRAKLSTSEFATPHVALGAGTAWLTDNTPRNERGEIIGIQAGTYRAAHTTLELEGVPVLYWPFAQGDFSQDTMALRGAKVGYQNRLGAVFETRWYLFNLLGLEAPPGTDATLRLDEYTKRGPGVGIDLDYVRENYYGLLRSYYINDQGSDRLGPIRGGEPDHENRGRALWRHRHYLPEDWQLVLEASYISDDNYLEQYERNEWENAKDQETVLYLLKRRANWQFSTLFNWRMMDFLSQTEHLPDAMFSLIGQPLTDWATYYHESRVGAVRYRPDDRRVFDSADVRYDNTGRTDVVARGDTRSEFAFPVPELGPIKLTPYLAGRAGAWDDTPRGSGEGRLFGSAGLRGNLYGQRTYDEVESDLLDVHRVRHVIKPDVGLWLAGSSLDSAPVTPFDQDVETIDDFSGVTLGLRQRWQTKRGGPGRWRTVDWIVWDVEAGFFSNKRPGDRTHGNYIFARPEDSISSNFLSTQLTYRISDTTVVAYDGVYDLNRGNAGTSALSLNIERDPRLAWFFGWRYIHDTDNNLIGFGANYKLNEKHTFAFREYYDIEFDRNFTTQLTLIRRWPRWYTAIQLDIDRPTDDVGISISAWPEGAPNLALGSKRFTGLGDSIGLRP